MPGAEFLAKIRGFLAHGPEIFEILEEYLSPHPHPGTPALLDWASARVASTAPALTDLSLPPARVELSGRVLVNWWAKDLGLLRDEFSLGPGSRVLFRTPAHWRTLPLALAALSLGATVLESATESPADVELLVTHEPSAPGALEAPEILAVTLETLAADFGSALPAGVVDHAAEVRMYPDRLEASAGEAAQAEWACHTASSNAQGTISELLGISSEEAAAGADGGTTSMSVEAGLLVAVAQLLATGAHGSLVLHDGPVPTPSVTAQERITRAGGLRL